MRAEPHPEESRRLEALRAYGALDTPREEGFDDLVALAASICETPIAFISLVDADRQWFKAEIGLGIEETAREVALCAHTIRTTGALEIEDLTADPRTSDVPAVTGEPHLRFYSAVVLESEEGLPLGTLCVMDTRPRQLNAVQRETLRVLGRQVMALLELGHKVGQLQAQARALVGSEARYRTLFTSMSEGFCVVQILLDPEGHPVDYRFVTVNDAFERLTGISNEAARDGRTIRELVPGIEPFFIHLYGRVALTGQAEEYVQHAASLNRWFEGRVVPFGEPESLQVAVLFNEVTETKRAELERERILSELALEREKLDTILSLSPSFVAIVRGEDLVFEYANPAYVRLTGGRPLIGRRLAEALPEVVTGGVTGQDYDRFLMEVMRGGEARRFVRETVALQSAPDGGLQDRILDFSFYPLREEDGGAAVLIHGADVTDSVRADREILEREELFRTVFEQAPDDAIVVMDAERTITAWNPAAERICGWRADEAIGQKADIIFTAEDRTKGAPAAEVNAAARLGKAEDERWQMRKEGSRFWGSGTMNALHDAEGNVRGYLKVFRDATERYEEAQTLAFLSLLTEAIIDLRHADEILATVERMLGQYLGASRVTFGEFAEDGDTFTIRQEWGPEVNRIAGTFSLESFGKRISGNLRSGRTHVIVDASRELAGEPALASVREGQIMAAITVPVLKEGRLASMFLVHQNTPREWTDDEISLVQQVTDRMAAEIERARVEEALRASEERFRQLVDLSPSTVWFGEPDGGLSYLSQDFYDATGLTPEMALPQGWTTAVHPEDLPAVLEEWESARRDERLYDTEFRLRHRDGECRWVSSRAVPMRDTEGRVTGWLGSNHDIHERKTAEETLQARVEERTAQLQAAVKEAEGFNYSISHDLRTPLRAMVATSSILIEEAGPELAEEHQALLRRQSENAKRLGQLIDELLRLSRLSRVPVSREPLDMTAKAEAVAVELEQSKGLNGCVVEVQPGMTAEGDAALVRTVFQNLIGNACKFSPNGGTVRVRKEGEVFSVSDQGVGFDMQFAPKIFLPFERLVSEKEFSGTGIGLANVKRIIDRHGGEVWAESAPGEGATFFFTLGAKS